MTIPTPANTLDIVALNDLKDMLGDALAEIAVSFMDGLEGEVTAILQALESDSVAVRGAAHSLKGSAGNMGARVLASLASSIEQSAVNGDMGRCAELCAGLPATAAQARQALADYIAQT